ncbi:MAG: MMPL family transporter [Roseibacillus sp.]|nr:MMPL family transporter [Roseibacillus sp.]
MTRLLPVLAVSLVGILAVLAIMRVRFSSDIYELLPEDLPEARGLEQINRYFSRDAQLIVTVRGESSWAVEEASDALAALLWKQDELVEDLFQELNFETLVVEGGPLLAWAWFNSPPEQLTALEGKLASGQSRELLKDSLARINDAFSAENALVLSYDPLGLAQVGPEGGGEGAFAADPMRSVAGDFEIFYVEGKGVDFSDYREVRHWLDQVEVVVAKWLREWNAGRGDGEQIEVGMTGTPAFMAEIGSEMERDMTVSVLLTLVLISVLFFLMHRQLGPLSWLLVAMMGVLAVTLTIAELALGKLSVMSVGFAAILMGLAVDYGIVLYREALGSQGSARELRRTVGPGITWAAVTTAAVFLSLNLSSLPGLAEMGNLVALGILVGAVVMLFGFAPVASVVARKRSPAACRDWMPRSPPNAVAVAAGICVPLVALGVMIFGEVPGLQPNFHPFRMKESPALAAWKEMRVELYGESETTPAVIKASDFENLHIQLEAFDKRVSEARKADLLDRVILPSAWVPHPEYQRRNADVLQGLVAERTRLLSEIDEAGFTEEGMALTRTVIDSWEKYLGEFDGRTPVFPAGSLAKWTIDRIVREKDGTVAAIAALRPVAPRDRSWIKAVCNENANVASLSSLGTALNERIREDSWRVFLPMLLLLTVLLAMIYRSWRELVLTLFALTFGAAVLVILTACTPLSWNSFNVCGIPLLFGTGLDFSVHMLFALRRSGGNLATVRRGMGKAVTFCGLSSAIGFGSLATASAHGLSSLGVVCAVGILVNTLIAVVLLPSWYQFLHNGVNSTTDSRISVG